MQSTQLREVTVGAPGRVNLLGEHTDYTGGLVLPLAIDRVTEVTATRRSDGRFVLRSVGYAESIHLAERPRPGRGHWSSYALGIIDELWDRADLRGGFTLEVGRAPVPPGLGLGSSAALTVACGRALARLFDMRLDPLELALAGRRAEQRYADVQCGIMDQVASALLDPGDVLFLDCHTLATRTLRLPNAAVVIIPSGVTRSLSESGYNQRVSECAQILDCLRQERPGLACLGALGLSELPSSLARTPVRLRPRLEHVVSENARVRDGLALLEAGDLPAFGRLMFASHASLSELYHVSCAELDAIVEAVRPLVYGAKMTGAGFGGAVVALVDLDRQEELGAAVSESCITVVVA